MAKKNKRTIPELRARLNELAEEHNLPELAEIADETFRNPPVSRAKVQSKTLTPELAARIRRYARAHPGTPQDKIGALFKVNPGRVSEALNNLI